MKFVLSAIAAAAAALFAAGASADGDCSGYGVQTTQTDQTVVASVPAPSTPAPATTKN
jgi:hypothetical protein